MVDSNPSFDDVINHVPGTSVDLMRFCLSDQCYLPLSTILGPHLSPATYAQDVLRHHYPILKKRFLKDIHCDKKVPDVILRAILFENLVANALVYRVSIVRRSGMDDVMELMSSAYPFLLSLNKAGIAESDMCGLSEFSTVVEIFIRRQYPLFECHEIHILNRLADKIGCVEKADWLLYDKEWRAVYLRRPEWIILLRNLLFVAMTSYGVNDEQVEQVFGLEREDIFACMTAFIELRELPKVTFSDIQEFFYFISPYFNGDEENQFFMALLQGPFAMFESFHHHHFGDRFLSPSHSPTISVPVETEEKSGRVCVKD